MHVEPVRRKGDSAGAVTTVARTLNTTLERAWTAGFLPEPPLEPDLLVGEALHAVQPVYQEVLGQAFGVLSQEDQRSLERILGEPLVRIEALERS